MHVVKQIYSHVTENMNHKAKEDLEKFIEEKVNILKSSTPICTQNPQYNKSECKKATRNHPFRMTRVAVITSVSPLCSAPSIV
ncbi:hypothetical protein BU061_04185 [Staphylococcus succinus]|uniref:Uncharacterized protein n=1 Tax=Staphylococcus succinus TaxID=61015 RepID=A0ABX5IPY9_9STAP|nr:hypothetical protein BU057_01680 [Staphylococcus succinus]RIN39386.1 hypothetical protein BU061_04185 [Staphylococcus succinus]